MRMRIRNVRTVGHRHIYIFITRETDQSNWFVGVEYISMFHPNVPPLILRMVNGYVATDTVVVTEMDEGGDTRFASVTADDIDILVQNKDSENTKKISKAAVAVFRGYWKKESAPTLYLCHWKNYVNY